MYVSRRLRVFDDLVLAPLVLRSDLMWPLCCLTCGGKPFGQILLIHNRRELDFGVQLLKERLSDGRDLRRIGQIEDDEPASLPLARRPVGGFGMKGTQHVLQYSGKRAVHDRFIASDYRNTDCEQRTHDAQLLLENFCGDGIWCPAEASAYRSHSENTGNHERATDQSQRWHNGCA